MSGHARVQDIGAFSFTSGAAWIISMAVSWSLAAGAAGAFLMAGLVLTGRLHSMDVLLLAAIVAGVASVLGATHGALLGYLGRPEPSEPLGWRRWFLIGGASFMAFAASVVLGIWVGLSAMAARAGQSYAIIALSICVPVVLAVFAWATIIGWRAVENAYRRWPDKRLGTALVIGAFFVLSAFMLLLRGAIPGTEIRLSPWGSIIIAVVAVLWIVSPAVIVSLRLGHFLPHR